MMDSPLANSAWAQDTGKQGMGDQKEIEEWYFKKNLAFEILKKAVFHDKTILN